MCARWRPRFSCGTFLRDLAQGEGFGTCDNTSGAIGVRPAKPTQAPGNRQDEDKATGVVEHRYSVHSPERVVAVVTRGGVEAGTHDLHVDHLGSIESVTNEEGSQVEKRSYDPFGQRRNVIWGLPPPASPTSKATTRGFTGHEGDDDLGLVNMRGRMFDPRLGRFLTTDPVIADVFDGQSHNRYSYVRNAPLSFVDPTGHAGAGGSVGPTGAHRRRAARDPAAPAPATSPAWRAARILARATPTSWRSPQKRFATHIHAVAEGAETFRAWRPRPGSALGNVARPRPTSWQRARKRHASGVHVAAAPRATTLHPRPSRAARSRNVTRSPPRQNHPLRHAPNLLTIP
ncbi:RHS repeat domain-containing protein [Polyangium fumosum]|uniref:RHS repeat-associated core domain-containing protein n=1 Tax=Polyangium fumosum TaxID=889272 RepID=A0A4U1JEQ2_9BACT|nr:RHS repeat-associated core domain-containing protein [Polyangium fumosum]